MGVDNLHDIFDSILLDFTEMDVDKVKDSVQLMTVHASKGLEFPITIVGGFSRAKDRDEDFMDESNIQYVHLSRAIDKLVILDTPLYIDRRFKEYEAKYSKPYKNLKFKLGV